MNRGQHRDQMTGRWAKVDPEKDLAPVNVSAEDVYVVSGNSLHGKYDAPQVTDEPEVLGPLRHRVPVDEYGIRQPFGRVGLDADLVGQAQAGTRLVPGTERL